MKTIFTRHTSCCRCVGCTRSPQSLTYVSSWGFAHLPPSCNMNYLGKLDVKTREEIFNDHCSGIKTAQENLSRRGSGAERH
ncbi:hypothetical protein AL497_25620 [Klebsiella aerogenes]|nr:hypothetical protein CRN78_04880 [Klebsiella aerogenes]ATX86363.1 hypothetical protein AM345_05515 [Klebsiella aerogenes]ATX99469.1 hypothetical protein AM334_00985 [Klebsiella aerogenes]ATY06316.1 hypothetical protein AM336_12450 [Klebsiella aerogenes]AUY89088.1 hypothetical protein AL497_25620 [Klebsiella aerogenes]